MNIELIKKILGKIRPCCLYCVNTYKRVGEYPTVEEFEKIERGELLREEFDMRASLPHEKFTSVHCDLKCIFVNTTDVCSNFKYRCSIIQEGYEIVKRDEAAKKRECRQLKLF